MNQLMISTIDILYNILFFLILARVIISWIRPGVNDPRWRKLLTFIYNVTEPILGPIRKNLPTGRNMGIDFSPFIAIIALMLIRSFLIFLLQ